MSAKFFMGQHSLQKSVLASALLFGASLAMATDAEITPAQMVNAIEDVFGISPAYATSFAKRMGGS